MANLTGGKHRLELEFAGTRIGIGSDDAAALTWLEEFLSPAFETDSGSAVNYSIAFEADEAAYARLIQQATVENCT